MLYSVSESDGECVTCPPTSTEGSSSICARCQQKGGMCVFRLRDCKQCERYECVGSKSTRPVRLTVGLVLTFVILLIILLLTIYYFKFWKKRKPHLDTSKGGPSDDGKVVEEEVTGRNISAGRAASMRGIYQSGNRSSAATVMTRASNVLPVAYIPGVTAVNKKFRGRRMFNNNGDTRSHITLGSSIFGGDDDDADDEVEIPPISRDRDSTMAQHANNLTTAIRARPKLVQISEEEEAEDRHKYLSSLDQRSRSENEHTADDSLKAPSNVSGSHSGEDKWARVGTEPATSSHSVIPSEANPLNTLETNAVLDDSDSNKRYQTSNARSANILQEESDEILHHRNDTAYKTNHDSDDDDDDEGSFILDVEVAEPRLKTIR